MVERHKYQMIQTQQPHGQEQQQQHETMGNNTKQQYTMMVTGMTVASG